MIIATFVIEVNFYQNSFAKFTLVKLYHSINKGPISWRGKTIKNIVLGLSKE